MNQENKENQESKDTLIIQSVEMAVEQIKVELDNIQCPPHVFPTLSKKLEIKRLEGEKVLYSLGYISKNPPEFVKKAVKDGHKNARLIWKSVIITHKFKEQILFTWDEIGKGLYSHFRSALLKYKDCTTPGQIAKIRRDDFLKNHKKVKPEMVSEDGRLLVKFMSNKERQKYYETTIATYEVFKIYPQEQVQKMKAKYLKSA